MFWSHFSLLSGIVLFTSGVTNFNVETTWLSTSLHNCDSMGKFPEINLHYLSSMAMSLGLESHACQIMMLRMEAIKVLWGAQVKQTSVLFHISLTELVDRKPFCILCHKKGCDLTPSLQSCSCYYHALGRIFDSGRRLDCCSSCLIRATSRERKMHWPLVVQFRLIYVTIHLTGQLIQTGQLLFNLTIPPGIVWLTNNDDMLGTFLSLTYFLQ